MCYLKKRFRKRHTFINFSLIASLIVLFSTLILSSCESQRQISVTVFNEKTSKVIDSVLIKISAGKNGDFTRNQDEGYTNKEGRYETYMMVGCTGGCYDIKIEYLKENFKRKETLNQIKDTVYLTPIN